MRGRRLSGLAVALFLAAIVLFGFQAPTAEARGFNRGSHHGGLRHHMGVNRHSGFRHQGHHFQGSRVFVGVGLGVVSFPYVYPAYRSYPAYPSYVAYPYAGYPAYTGPCYSYDAYGRCVSYAPAAGYYYQY